MDNQWDMLESSNDDREKIWAKNRTFAGDVWFRFRKKPTAAAGFVLIVLLLLFALAGPFFSTYSYSEQNLAIVNIPPFMNAYDAPDGESHFYITQNLKIVVVYSDGTLGTQLKKIRDEDDKRRTIYGFNGTEVALDYSQKPYSIVNLETGEVVHSSLFWNQSHIFGTDGLGRDILTRLMYGTRISLMVAAIAVLVNMVVGIIYGSISGYFGGRTDMIMMRIVDIISTIPLTLYVILIMVVAGNGLHSIIIALGSVYWVDMARVVRGQTLSLKEQEFIVVAKTIGSSTKTIIFRHLVPNAMGVILVTVTMLIPSAIFMEAFLGYLGIGLQPPMASLGTMCNDATETLRTNPYQLFIPAAAICLIMFAFNFVGDGLRDALDPKLKK